MELIFSMQLASGCWVGGWGGQASGGIGQAALEEYNMRRPIREGRKHGQGTFNQSPDDMNERYNEAAQGPGARQQVDVGMV